MKECINCKIQLEDDELFCHECGTKQELNKTESQADVKEDIPLKKCPQCGEEIEDDSDFCPYCGNKINSQDSAGDAIPQNEEEKTTSEEEEKEASTTNLEYEIEDDEDKSKRRILYISLFVVFAIIGGICLYQCMGRVSHQEEVVDTAPIAVENKPLEYETFLELYEAFQDRKNGWYKMPSKELINKYGLDVKEWTQPQFSLKKRVIGINVIQDDNGNPLANGEHAWCFYWEAGENDPQLYLYIYETNDYNRFVADAKKYGLVEVIQPKEYDEGYETVVYAVRTPRNGNMVYINYNDRERFGAIGPFVTEGEGSIRLGFGGIEGYMIEEVEADEEDSNNIQLEDDESQEMSSNENMKTSSRDEQSFSASYIFGTAKALKDNGIISDDESLPSNFNKNGFTKIDTRVDQVFKLYSQSAHIITSHPSGSYTLMPDANGQYVLKITNPQTFWSKSKYLVILTK